MKRIKVKRWLSIAIVACLLITSTPLKAMAEEIDESHQWQEILTTFGDDQNKNSVDTETSTPAAIKKDTAESTKDEIQFSLEAANEEFKTDRFIIKYKDDVEMGEVVDIPDLKADAEGKERLEEIADSLEQNDVNEEPENSQSKSEKLDEIQESISVEISTAQLELSQTPIDSATVVESENIMVLDTKKEMTGAEFADILETKEVGQDIEYIQPDYELGMSAVDPYREEQWGHYQMYSLSTSEDSLKSEEDSKDNSYRMDANVLEAWEKTKGEGAVVALLDTGIETSHVDLKDNLLDGWDFVNDDDSVNDIEWKYDQWHGTHIAGIIAAKAGNGVGVAGVAPEAKILPLKIFQSGTAYTSDIIDAINYAEMCGAKIANCSWGTQYDNPALKTAIENSSMVFVCASGNNLYDTDKYPVYPASYDLNNVISVTSIDQDGKLSRFANYGKQSVDIAAPGRDIYSTTIDNGYAANSGTSMSAGYVSGALAVLLSKDQTKTAKELKKRIISSGDKITGLVDKVKDGKKLNCDYALSINPFPNFNSIKVDDSEPLPELSPNGETEQTQDEYDTYAENTISVKTPMPTARHGLGVVAVGNKIYAIGGQLASGYSNKVEEYDPKTDTWKTKANMPTASSYFGIAKINDQIYVLGGYNGAYLNTVQVYTPATDTWATMPTSQNMPVAMKSFAAAAYNGKIYVTGGYNGTYLNTIYEYTPVTGTWTQKQSLSKNRGEHVAVEYGGKIYIDGGCTTGGSWFNSEEIFDPSTNQVQQNGSSTIVTFNGAELVIGAEHIAIGGKRTGPTIYDNSIQQGHYTLANGVNVNVNHMYYSRSGLGIAEVNGKVYMIGGENSGSILPTVEELDLGWEIKGQLPQSMKNFVSVECNGKLYLLGGENVSRLKTVYEYNPESNSWLKKADMPAYRQRFAVSVAYGKIYIIGGAESTTSTGSAYIDNKVYEFNPIKNTWTQKNGISSAKYDCSATTFNNHIYISGGRDSAGQLVGNVEVFDPVSNTWENKASIPAPTVNHFMTVSNNKILLVDGNHNYALEYDEKQDSWNVKLSGIAWTTAPYSNRIVNIYGNIFNFDRIISGKQIPFIYKYDPNANKIASYSTFYLFNKGFEVVTLNNKVYTFDGAGIWADTLIEYRPRANPWLTQNGSGRIASRLMGTSIIGQDIYLLGGDTFQGNTSVANSTNAAMKLNTQTNSWQSIKSMNYVRSELGSGVINGKIYAVGGRNSLDPGKMLPYLEEYDPSTNTWAVKANIPKALSGMACAVYNGKLYLFGGMDGGASVSNATYIYNPQTNSWATGASMPTARFGCGAAALTDGKIYVEGGAINDKITVKKVEVYDPQTNTWTTKKDMPVAFAFSGIAGTESMYVIGGTDFSTANGTVYEYSPITDKWFSWPGPGQARLGVGVAIANNGIYVINGADIMGNTYSNVDYLPLGSFNSDYIHLGEESINLSGNLARNYTDMSYTSQGFQINFSRTYNSRDDRTEGNIISKGWTFGFQGKISSAGNDTLARLPNGSGYLFKENIDGTFVAKDSRSTLLKHADGSYILTTKDLYSYGFNSNGNLTWMKDRNGNTVTITVDTAGKITQITDPAGRQTNISYSNNKIYKITDFAGRVVEYSYNASGYLSAVIDPMGNSTRYTYNSGGFLTDVKDHNSNPIESFNYFDIPSHETLPKIKTMTDPLGKTDTYQYDEGEGNVTITDNNKRQNVTWYDKMLYPIRVKDAEGKEQHIEYNLSDGVNKYGEERVVIDRRGNATYYDRDANGNVIKKINPDGSIKEFSYDDKNNLISEKDETGKLTSYVYDSNKINLLKTVKPLNGTDVYSDSSTQANFAITTNTYYTAAEAQTMCGKSINGLLKSVMDPEGNTTTYTYDAYGNNATMKNALNQTATYQYNPVGWLKQETSVKGYATKYYYDRNGKMIKKIGHGGDAERVIYDNKGHITQNIKPNQYVATNDTASAFDPNNILTNLNSYGVSGEGYRYAYYSNGLLCKEIDPLNNETSYTYDQYGNALTKTFANGYAQAYTYDALNRVKSAAYQTSSSAAIVLTDEYSYNVTSEGYLEKNSKHYFNSSSAPETAVSKETYNYADKLIRTDNADGGYSTNEYMTNGNLSIVTDPMGNKVYYAYDGLNRESGRWSTVSDGTCSYEGKEYDKNGNVKKQIGSTDTVASYSIPTSGIKYKNFIYDAAGRIIEQGDSQGGKITYSYEDTTDKVTQKQYTSASEYVETASIYNHLGKVKEIDLKVNSEDLEKAESVLKTTYTFDKEGNTLTQTKPNNVTTTYTYDLLGRILSQSEPGTDENGNPATLTNNYTYDFRGDLLTEKDSLGRTKKYTYTLDGLLLKVTDPKSRISYTERNPDNLVVAEVTPKNYTEGTDLSQMNRTTYQYDNRGRVIKENKIYKDLSGTFQTITKEYTYDKNGNLLTSKDGMGYVTTYTYDGQNRQWTVLEPDGEDKSVSFTVKYSYNGIGQKTSEENGIHAVTGYTYNDQGKVLSVDVDGVTAKSCTYDLAGNMLSESDGNDNTTSYTYNALGKVKTRTLSDDESIPSHTISYVYTNAGDIAKTTDTLGKMNVYTYDNQHHPLSEKEMTSDESQSITKNYCYDLAGNLRFTTDGNGNKMEFTYDALNQKLSQKVSVTINGTLTAQTTSYEYDADGKVTGTTDWLGNKYVNVYDALDRVVEKKDPFGNTIEKLTYDNNHRQIGSTDALDNTVTFAYDKANRLISKTDASGNKEQKSYDVAGNIISSTDGNGNTTNYEYDARNRLVSAINALQQATSYTYDAAGNLLTQTDGKGNVSTYQYNARNLPTVRIDAGGFTSDGAIDAAKSETYQYNSDGKLAGRTDRNGVASTYTYDIHGRLQSEDVGGDIESYTYDNNNNQLTMTDTTGTTTRAYDELGRTTSKSVPTVGTTIFTYDQVEGVPAGYVNESYQDPKGNKIIRTKDKAGRLYQVKDGSNTTTYTYYDNGNLQKLEYPNGATEENEYYANNKLHTLVNKQGSSTLEAFSYEYDGAGNMTGKADRKGTTAYTYDNLNRLQTVTEATGKVTAYEFDAAGNRNSETVTDGSNVTKTEYAYDEQNRLIGTNKLVNSEEAGGEDYGFDNNGNVLSVLPHTVTASAITTTALTVELSALGSEGNQSDTAVYEYDTRNQMVKSVEGTNTVESAYNGDGLRVSKTVNGQTSNYLYEYDKIILETDGSNAQIAQNVYGNNLINRSVDSDNLYYMYNGHGDVTSLQTMDGNSAAEYYYDAFGTATEVTGEANNPFRYAGYEYDDETDLYYLKSRMYNSVTARFMQEDTYRGQANDPLSLNLYTYCNNNPLIYHDPDGHITTAWDKKKLNRAQQAALSIQTRLYDSKTAKGDTAGAAAAHAAAESIRNTARSSNEVGSASGYTYTASKNGSASLNKYDSSALDKVSNSSSATLNGSSYLPEQVIKSTNETKSIDDSYSIRTLVADTNNKIYKDGIGYLYGHSYLLDSDFDKLNFKGTLPNGHRYKVIYESGRCVIAEYTGGNIVARWMTTGKVGNFVLGGNGDQIFHKLELTVAGNFSQTVSYSYSDVMEDVYSLSSDNSFNMKEYMYYDSSSKSFLSSTEWKNTIHYEERFALNSDESLPESPEQALNSGFEELSKAQAKYHGAKEGNRKFVSADGREAIYSKHGDLLTLKEHPDIGPTYNYVPPGESGIGHFYFDMLPFYWWGSGKPK